ncbi:MULTISPECIES: DUF397 domain-containing protein [Catenuloplanes]|uniref:DUF397 domain-containing protein n=1 Tax=Catenuloplanes niger TaxID=587534 RepID=A0AAE3ZTY3_9ACTN|nr:DUF397 domain-containing protein [Catenuloplanes niger]MDR7324932.1 hypothetical protein [Catenuloplanes niger]
MATAMPVRRSATGVPLSWFRSSRSGSTANCVEVAKADGPVLVRDSKDRAGPVLEFAPQAWAAFVDGLTPRPANLRRPR